MGTISRLRAAAAASAVLLGGVASAQFGGMRVYENARVIGADGAVREVSFSVTQGSIAQTGRQVQAPPFARKVDLAGRFVSPGLIDADSSLFMLSGLDADGLSATSKAADALDLYDDIALRDAWRNGVTGVFVPAVGAAGIAGQGALVRLSEVPGIVNDEAALCIRLDGASPTERLEVYNEVREAFRQAKLYRESRDIYDDALEDYEEELKKALEEWEKKQEEDDEAEGDDAPDGAEDGEGEEKADAKKDDDKPEGPEKPERPGVDLAAEVLLRAIDDQLPVRIVAHSSADIQSAIELAEQGGFPLVVVGGAEAHLVAEQLAEADASVILTGAPSSYRDIDPAARVSALLDAGVTLAVGSGFATDSGGRFVLLEAQRQSGGQADALGLVTSSAASVLGAESWGAVGQGSAADFVVWDSDPRLGAARVFEVYVAGDLVYRSPMADEEGE